MILTSHHFLPILSRIIYLTCGLTVGWWLLAGHDDWLFGGFAVALITVVSLIAAPAPVYHWHFIGLIRFAIYFIVESFKGGVDITRRAFRTEMPLQPVLIPYPLNLPTGSPATVFAITMTLMPGTLSVELTEDTVIVHSLTPEMAEGLKQLEIRVADLFGLKK